MKTCPSCRRVYEDDAQVFCLEDGSRLVSASEASYDPGATMKIPAGRMTLQDPTEVVPGNAAAPTQTSPQPPPTQRYGTPAQRERKPSALPWILGAAAILGLSAIVVALIVTRRSGPETAQTTQNVSQPGGGSTSENANGASVMGDAPMPNTSANQPVNTLATPATTSNTQVGRTTEPATQMPRPVATATLPPVVADEPPPPPAPKPTPPPAPRAPISGGVLNGKAISLPKPPYPAIAKAAHASGTVTVQVTIDESGKVISAKAISGHPLLQQAAVQAAYGARFTPTQLSGQPVKVTGILLYNFVAQ